MKVLESVKQSGNSAKLARHANGRPVARPASVGLAGDSEPLLSCWETLDGRVRLILSRDGKLIARSKGAHRLLSQSDCLVCISNLTLASAASSNKRLQRILDVGVGAVESMILPKRSGDGNYVVSATGLTSDTIAVAVRNADNKFVTVLADLEAAFGLTHCEVLVIEKLMHGQVPQQIADALAVSVHTVRAHLRHCYDKLQVSSREELWQRLAPYRLN